MNNVARLASHLLGDVFHDASGFQAEAQGPFAMQQRRVGRCVSHWYRW